MDTNSFEMKECTIDKIGSIEHITDSFRKRNLIIKTDSDKYPQTIVFEFVQDKVDLLDGFSVGDKVNVNFNLRGREWNEKVFNSLQAWSIKKIDNSYNSSERKPF